MKKNLKKHLNILIILAVSIIVLLPFVLSDYRMGDDSKYHVTNIEVLTQQYKKGLPTQIVGEIGNDFGYGTRLFYPPLAHTVTAVLNLLVNNTLLSIKLMYVVILFLSGATMYYLAKKIFKDDKIALLSSIIYVLFPYHLANIYVRDALAETFIFIFIPLIISSLYELYYGNPKKFYLLFIIGYIGGILSHLTMMIYLTVLIFIFLIVKYKETIKKIKYYLIATAFILLIASPFLINMIEHKMFGNYLVFKEGIMAQGIQLGGLFFFDYINVFGAFHNNNIKYFIDIVVLILLGLTLFKYKKIKNKYLRIFLIASVICIFCSTVNFPWDILPNSFRMIQFPWRFQIFVALFISLSAPFCLYLFKNKRIYLLIIIMLILALFNNNTRNAYTVSLDNLDYSAAMGWQKEYLSVNTANNIDYFNNRSKDIIGEAKIIENRTPNLTFEVTNHSTLELPRLYYRGYTLYKGKEKMQIYENNKGFIETTLEAGIYNLKYTGTVSTKVCTALSVLSIIGLIIFVRRNYEKN